MTKKLICITIIATCALLLASCVQENDYSPAGTKGGATYETPPQHHPLVGTELGERVLISEEEARARLLEMGWDEEWLDIMAEGVTLVNTYNQARFSVYIDDIYNRRPIGASGEVIAARYFGGLKFDETGHIVVSVLPAGLDYPPTATAVEEMLELGIIIRTVEFTQQSITDVINSLGYLFDAASAAGATSWGQGAQNAITVWLDPYSDEQKAIFNEFLLANGFDLAHFLIEPAVTPEMRDLRANYIAESASSPRDLIIHVGEADVSQTEIAFSLQNTTDLAFNYGMPWDLARYENGQWLPMVHLPGRASGWPMPAFSLQGGGIQQYRISFDWHFGALPPGRYMFVRDGWMGNWDERHQDIGQTFALVEFVVTDTTPMYLPPEPEWEPRVYVEVVEVSNVTPTGMRIVIENISPYGIEHRAQIISVVPAEHTTVGESWEWWEHHLPFICFDDIMQAEEFIPAGERREFDINLGTLFGELPPGDYKLELSLGGLAEPPHPHGWAFGNALIPFTIE